VYTCELAELHAAEAASCWAVAQSTAADADDAYRAVYAYGTHHEDWHWPHLREAATLALAPVLAAGGGVFDRGQPWWARPETHGVALLAAGVLFTALMVAAAVRAYRGRRFGDGLRATVGDVGPLPRPVLPIVAYPEIDDHLAGLAELTAPADVAVVRWQLGRIEAWMRSETARQRFDFDMAALGRTTAPPSEAAVLVGVRAGEWLAGNPDTPPPVDVGGEVCGWLDEPPVLPARAELLAGVAR
jgi:hypothetical protein